VVVAAATVQVVRRRLPAIAPLSVIPAQKPSAIPAQTPTVIPAQAPTVIPAQAGIH